MSLTTHFQRVSLGVLLVFAIGLAACGTATASAPSTTPGADAPGSSSGADAPGTGGDEPNIVYTDAAGGFHFSHPQSWTKTTASGETVRFTGRDEFISVTIIMTTMTPTDYAQQDNAALVAASPGFAGKAAVNQPLNAGKGVMVAYQWNAGPSPVTGKLVPSSANRFYIPGPSGKLAVYTYSAPNQVYDPAGAIDFANTFGWR